MPDKARERFYLSALHRALGTYSAGPIEEPEPPDFVYAHEGGRLGVEMTAFHLPARPGERPHQERQNLKNRIVDCAEQLHREAGGPPLYVTVHFSPHHPLHKRDTQPLARAIADSVLHFPVPRSLSEPGVEIPWRNRPDHVAGILIHGSIDGRDHLWHADAGGWVAEITAAHVREVIRAKARQAPLARGRCDKLWLVIVNDDFSLSAPAEISEEGLNATYDSPFDRLIWLIPHQPKALDLHVGTGAG